MQTSCSLPLLIGWFLTTPLVSAQSLDRAELLALLKEAVFQVVVTDGAGRPFQSGSGFLIDDAGFAITNEHVVRGGAGAVARFEGVEEDVPLELWAVAEGLDLALIRVTLPEPRNHLGVAVDAPEGTPVWAVGYPKGLGFTVTAGIVNGVRDAERLPIDVSEFGASARFVQTDATINPGNSGGPIVTMDAEVVGVSTFSWLNVDNAFFAVEFSHVTDLIAARTEPAITFGAVEWRERSEVRQLQAKLRLPILEVAPSVHPGRVVQHARSAARLIKCRTCEGARKLSKRVKTGSYPTSLGPVDNYSTIEQPCGSCGATGYAEPDVINRVMERVVDGFVRMDPAHARHFEQARFLMQELATTALQTNVEVAGRCLNARMNEILAEGPEVEAPAWFIGTITDELWAESDIRAAVVQVDGTANLVLVTGPRMEGGIAGDRVLVTGLVAGSVNTEELDNFLVVQGGTILSAKP